MLYASTGDGHALNSNSTTAVAIGNKVKELIAAAKLAPAPLLVCLGRDRVIFKDVKFPRVPPHEEPAIVRFQATKDLTEPPDSVLMDYVPARNEGGPGSRATAVFLRKDLYSAVKLMADTAGLKLAAVTARPFSTAAAIRLAIATGVVPAPEEPKAAIAVLSIWDGGGEFVVCEGNELLLSRTVPAISLGSEATLIGEMRRNLAVCATQFPHSPLHTLYVVEGLSSGQSWSGRLRTALPINVITLDPLAGSPVAQDIPTALRAGFFGPIGLLATRTTADGLSINFVSIRQPRNEPSKHRLRALIAVLLLVATFAIIFAVGYMQLSTAQRELTNANTQKDSLSKLNEKLKLEQKKFDAVEDFADREVPWLDVFYDISVQFPDIKRGKLLSMEGTLEKPPVVAGRPGQPAPKPVAVAPGTRPAKAPSAKLKLLVASDDIGLVDRLNDAFKPPFYEKTNKDTGKREGSNENVKLYTIETMLMRRKPDEFQERLIASPPPPAKVVEPEEIEEMPFVDPLGGAP